MIVQLITTATALSNGTRTSSIVHVVHVHVLAIVVGMGLVDAVVASINIDVVMEINVCVITGMVMMGVVLDVTTSGTGDDIAVIVGSSGVLEVGSMERST